jgi:hypothetical protein
VVVHSDPRLTIPIASVFAHVVAARPDADRDDVWRRSWYATAADLMHWSTLVDWGGPGTRASQTACGHARGAVRRPKP